MASVMQFTCSCQVFDARPPNDIGSKLGEASTKLTPIKRVASLLASHGRPGFSFDGKRPSGC